MDFKVEKKSDFEVEKKSAARIVPAASRTIAILRLLSRAPQPLSLREISSELGLIPSTCLHILRVLVEETLVSLDPSTKRYKLGFGVLSLARSVLARDMLIDFFRMEMETLANRFGVSTVATKLEGGRALTIAASVPQNVFAINTEVGMRFPVYMSGTGRLVAAFGDIDSSKMVKMLDKGQWARKPTPKAWLAEVEECKRRGYAVDREAYIAGVTVVAAPVFDSEGTLTHSLGAVSTTHTVERIGVDVLGKALISVADRAKTSG
jgi:DNA-binding IclR family transcriptional regulator